MLFNKKILLNHLNKFEYPEQFEFKRINKIIFNWQTAIKDGKYEKTKEIRVQATFLTRFFNDILGYAEMHDCPDEWYLINEAKTEVDSTKADGALGFFSEDEKGNVIRAVIELKDAKTPLDKKQSSRKDYDSPVSQAFSYSSKFDRCDWIVVSNFREIRLYHKDRGQGYYEKFLIEEFNVKEDINESDLFKDEKFKRFYFLLCKQNLLDKDRNSLLDKLVKDTSKQEDEISKSFYKEFKAVRQSLFNHLAENNPEVEKKCLLEKTQKLLDRMIFVFFCEDSYGLLPSKITNEVYRLGIKSRERSDQRVWREFKNLFQDINEGRYDIDPPINAYNGGLFAEDKVLNNLIIKDDIWEEIVKLANYDFESDLNVNILGHIFEQSLSDLEKLKNELDGIESNNKKSKRKKDGIYYTPEYITRYIVEQTLGKYLEENPNRLESVKILDPACGSGAFLNQAHSFLQEQHRVRWEEKLAENYKDSRNLNIFEHQNLAEVDKSILLNNIFGVDLNEESTEITKLALWLKTAKKTEPLQNLDNNIKCGNSLIDDPDVAGEKAFNWQNEFEGIFEKQKLKAFHLTWATHNSRYSEKLGKLNIKTDEAIWLDEKSESIITNTIDRIVREDSLKVLAYNICGDHIHLIIVCCENELESIVRKFKSISSREHNIKMGWTVPDEENKKRRAENKKGITQNKLWAKSYNASILESSEYIVNAINYVEKNRKKHGLTDLEYCKNPCEYNKENPYKQRVMTLCSIEKAFEDKYEGGFDVIIGNPPYVRQEFFSEIKPFLEKNYEVYTGVSDLYVYFFEKGLNLLKEGGYFAFIVSNKFLKAGYGKKLTQYLQKNYKIVEMIDFGDLQIFEGAITYPCIITIKKEKPEEKQSCTCLKLKNLDNVTDLKIEVNSKGFELIIANDDETWASSSKQNFDILEKLKKNNIPLGKYINDSIYYGIKTGFNEAFIINTETKEKLCKKGFEGVEIIKPLIKGCNILPYNFDYQNLWIIFTRRGINIDKYPAIKEYLSLFKEKLEPKPKDFKGEWKGRKTGSYEWYEIQDNIAYYENFAKPKIIWGNLAKKASFAYDDKNLYINAPACIIPTNEKWLLSLLNSKISTYFLKNTAIERQGGFIEQKPVYVKQIPIPNANKEQQKSLAQKANQMMELNKNLNESSKHALNFIETKYQPKKIPQKLQKFWQIGANPFIDELKKQKVNLTLKEEEELIQWYKEKQMLLNDLENQINQLDKNIDLEVYKLYDLSDEEVKIIEEA